ncbi:MAG: tRNA guanosine(34) transglycosylase Tgt [Phycisphaerae bacterium]|nr:tRNA guanosine(34) transglycosylase Tgt [Phycisphaerae bacterium]
MAQLNITHRSGKARRGRLITPHGEVDTPVFMPVGTAGTVKGLTPDQLRTAGAEIILGNTYHLMLRPGAEAVATLGGLHKLTAWDGPILTDSGGYQVFSLAHMRKISDGGVRFQSHIDGSLVELTPAGAVEIQHSLGADVMMQLDECPPGDAEREVVSAAVERSADWARRCRDAWNAYERKTAQGNEQALFGIQQGGVFRDLREQSARRLVELDLPGYAIGGLSVGEGHEAMCEVLEDIDGLLPADRPRYLMGVGEPRDILAAVLRGVDMFDCVLPTRNGRNAQAFTWTGRLRLRNAMHTLDASPIDPNCSCYACKNFSRGAIRHFFQADEMLGPILVSLHNLHFFAEFLAAIREAITDNTLAQKAPAWIEAMYSEEGSQ